MLALSFNGEIWYLLKNQSQRRFDYLLFDKVKQSIQSMSLCGKTICSDTFKSSTNCIPYTTSEVYLREVHSFGGMLILLTQFLCQAICTQRTPKGPKYNRRLNEHGIYIYIRHCQESNSQSVPSQAGADPTRPVSNSCEMLWFSISHGN